MRSGGGGTVTADALGAAVRAHADRVHDLALRSGWAPHEAPDVVQGAALQVLSRAAQGLADLPGVVAGWYAGALGEVTGRPGEPLAALTGPARAAVLLRDVYDLPTETVAGALGLAPAEALRTVGQARLALRPELAGGHPVDVGALARLAEDGGREQRHLRGCAACRQRLQAQREVREALAGLPVAALPDEQREGLLERVCVRARAVLAPPTAAAAPAPVLPRVPAALALLAAAGAGAAAGWLSSTPARPPLAAPPVPVVTAPPVVPLPPPPPPVPQAEPTTRVYTLAPTPPPTPAAPRPLAAPPPPAPAAPPAVQVAPTAGPPGAQVVASGSGWAPGTTVAVVLLDPDGRPTDSTADALVGPGGRFRVVLVAGQPGDASGEHRVQVSDATRSAGTAYRVVGPPASPSPVPGPP